jgi:hypothetical protein
VLQVSELFARVLGILQRVFRLENRLSRCELKQRQELAQAIIEYARTIQAYYALSHEVIVEIPELSFRFREPSHAIKEALTLLSEDGRAKAAQHGYWEVLPDGILSSKSDQGPA